VKLHIDPQDIHVFADDPQGAGANLVQATSS
jgi:hypothetical protein